MVLRLMSRWWASRRISKAMLSRLQDVSGCWWSSVVLLASAMTWSRSEGGKVPGSARTWSVLKAGQPAGNVALAVGPDVVYVRVRQERGGKEERYYLAKDRLTQLEGEYAIEKELKGRELDGRRYRPLFDFMDLSKTTGKKAYYVCQADFVTTKEGTGVVHTAGMYGEDDYQLGLKLDLPQHQVCLSHRRECSRPRRDERAREVVDLNI